MGNNRGDICYKPEDALFKYFQHKIKHKMVETIEPEGPQIREGEEPLPPATPTTSGATAPVNTSMQEDADKLLNDYFTKAANGMFKLVTNSNWQDHQPFNGQESDFGAFMASVVTCTPLPLDSNYNLPIVTYSVQGGKADFVPFLLQAFGDYALQIDIFQDEGLLSDFNKMAEYSPFLGTIASTFSNQDSRGYSPLSFALTMEKKHRHPFVLALDKQQGLINLQDHTDSISLVKDRVCIPELKYLVNVFQEYGLTELKPVMNEIDRVYELYKGVWKW